MKYIQAIETGKYFYSKEKLSSETKFNETILTQLRKNKGLNLSKLKEDYPSLWLRDQEEILEQHIQNNLVILQDGFVKLTRNGKLYADSIKQP